MPRKAKKKMHRMPKLSVLDQCIYWFLFLLILAICTCIFVIHTQLRSNIAFSDESVLASGNGSGFSWMMIPWMTTFIISLMPWLLAYNNRKPIFGLKNFKYGPPSWPRAYPLLMRNKPPVYISKSKRKERKVIAIVLTAILVSSWLVFPLSLYGRSCLYRDGSIIQYNVFNQEKRQFSAAQIRSVEIEAYRYSTGKYGQHKHWGVRVILVTDTGRDYYYPIGAFRENGQTDDAYWLTAMMHLKKCYDSQIVYVKGTENLGKVIEDKELSRSESVLLYELFELQ